MANEFSHITADRATAGKLTQAEFDKITAHGFASQATGDVLYASSATQLSRLGIGAAGLFLTVSGGIPAWQSGFSFNGSKLTHTPAALSGTPSTTGAWFDQVAQTFTDNVTAAAGTVAAMHFNSVQIPVFDALNGAAGANRVTATHSATWYWAGPPAPTTNKTLITWPWVHYINTGNIYFAETSAGVYGSYLTLAAWAPGVANVYMQVASTQGRIQLQQLNQTTRAATAKVILDFATTDTLQVLKASDATLTATLATGKLGAGTLPYATAPAGSLSATGGVMIGGNSLNNLFDDVSGGAGSTTMYIGTGQIQLVSDVRVKKDIVDYRGDALNLLRQARIVEHAWDDPSDRNPWGKSSRGRFVGMIAQETITWAPWVINAGAGRDCARCRAGETCQEHMIWQAEYGHLVPLVVKGVQELDVKIQNLDARLAAIGA